MNPIAPAADYAAVQDYLFSLKVQGVKFGVDRMRLFAAELGHPERAAPCVHVAGTNGKGSVSAMLESIFRAAGWRTGLYTSPHLVRLGERVQVDRRLLSEHEIIAFAAELRPVAERLAARGGADDGPSFFEFMTAMAFLQFARQRCDVSIIEVGLGGRLDATNIVDPELSVITSIGLEHCEFLGDTLELIAGEKAGIIKPGRPVVLGRMPLAAEAVIRAIAAERGSPVVTVAEKFGEDLARYPATNLEGDYQRWNAATATLAARLLPARWRLTDEGDRARPAPGRLARALAAGADRRPADDPRCVAQSRGRPRYWTPIWRGCVAETGRAPVVVTGVLGAVRARPLLEVICRHARELHLVVPQQARACSYTELEALLPATFRGRVVRATVEGLFPAADICTAGGADDVVVVTGSIYLLGEVMARLEPQRGPGEGRLQDF